MIEDHNRLGGEPDARWQPAADSLALAPGELHVWRTRIDENPMVRDRLLPILTDEEALIAQLFSRSVDAAVYITQRAMIRDVARRYNDGDPGLEWQRSARYARLTVPALPLQFEVAIDDAVVLCAVCRNGPVGCAAQRISPIFNLDDLLRYLAGADEETLIRAHAADSSVPSRWWAAKKAMALADDSPSLSLLPQRPVRVDPDGSAMHADAPWTMVEVMPDADHVGVIAVPGPIERVRLWQWSPLSGSAAAGAARGRGLLATRGARRPPFVDTHTHVVPSGDDGVSRMDTARELCEQASRRGTEILYATPHVWEELPLTPSRQRLLRADLAQLGRALGGLQLRLGFELTPVPSLLKEDPERYRLDGTDLVLIEADTSIAHDLLVTYAQYVASRGLRPLIAHPERSLPMAADPTLATQLRARGWLLQVSGGALYGRYGPMVELHAWTLLHAGHVQVVASDAHGVNWPPFLDVMHALSSERLGSETAAPLFDGSLLGL